MTKIEAANMPLDQIVDLINNLESELSGVNEDYDTLEADNKKLLEDRAESYGKMILLHDENNKLKEEVELLSKKVKDLESSNETIYQLSQEMDKQIGVEKGKVKAAEDVLKIYYRRLNTMFKVVELLMERGENDRERISGEG